MAQGSEATHTAPLEFWHRTSRKKLNRARSGEDTATTRAMLCGSLPMMASRRSRSCCVIVRLGCGMGSDSRKAMQMSRWARHSLSSWLLPRP